MHATKWMSAVGLVALGLLLAPSVRADLKEDRKLNYVIEIPKGWSWLPQVGAWGKQGIVVGAVRELEKIKTTGKKAKGEGAWMHLAIADAPEGKDLDALASDEEVRAFLMKRFGKDPESWPQVDVATDQYDNGLEIRVLVTEGESPNLKAKKCDTKAVMLLAIAKGKLYMLRMYAWHTEFDDEGLKSDLDFLEMSFDIPDIKEARPSQNEGEPPPTEEEPEAEPEGDEGEEKLFEFPELGIKLVKPKGIKSLDFDKDKYTDYVAWFEDNDHAGSYQIILIVFRRGRVINGQQAPDVDVREWITKKWWPVFTANHPDGPLKTFRWPKRSKSFITLPDWDKEKVLWEKPEKRPAELGSSAMMKKHKIVEKVKNQKLGKEKTNEAYRGSLWGMRPRIGREIVLRYAWGTGRVQCEISISLARGAEKKWGDKIRELLESIEMTGRR